MISSSNPTSQFLPRLSSFHFQSLQADPGPRTSKPLAADSAMRNPRLVPSDDPDDTELLPPHPPHHPHHRVNVNNPDTRRVVEDFTAINTDILPTTHTMTSPEDAGDRASGMHKAVLGLGGLERKKDRKSQARRYLVEGLSTPQHGNNANGGRRLYRSHTFNNTQGTTSSSSNPALLHHQRSLHHHNKHGKDVDGAGYATTSSFNNKYNIWNRMNGQKEDVSKVKRAIDNWNELVLELNSDHYRRLSIDSDSSSNEDVPSPLHKHRHRSVPLYASHSILPPSNAFTLASKGNYNNNNNNLKSNNPFADGLRFARYRPITPNLLIELDKNKMSSRKKTQRWINQLQVQSRSYNTNTTTSKTATQLPSESQGPSTDTVDKGAPSPDGVRTTPVDKTLHRTDSYGSTTRTRQSGPHFQSSRKQYSDFL